MRAGMTQNMLFCHLIEVGWRFQAWLQEFAWTERDIARCRALRKAHLGPQQQNVIDREPIFCMETMVRCFYWSLLAYRKTDQAWLGVSPWNYRLLLGFWKTSGRNNALLVDVPLRALSAQLDSRLVWPIKSMQHGTAQRGNPLKRAVHSKIDVVRFHFFSPF